MKLKLRGTARRSLARIATVAFGGILLAGGSTVSASAATRSAAAPTLAVATQAAPAGHGRSYHLAATFQVPVPADAIANGWCYDTAVVGPQTHRLYLADAANKQITVIGPRTGNITGIGTGLFTGIGGCHQFNYDQQGPNGTAIYGGDIFAGNGDSHVRGFSLRTGKLVADVNTGGKLRADEMTVAPTAGGQYLVVDNPAETPHPYMSFINLKTYHIDVRFTFADATGGLEQPRYWHGHLYVSVPQTTESANGGEVDELDISHLSDIRIIRTFPFATCQPAGLAIRADGLAAVGCGGPSATSQEILNLRNGKETPVNGGPGVDIVAVNGPDFFYVSYTNSEFVIADSAGNILQTFPATAASHTVAVDPANGDVWVPENAGDVNLYSPSFGGLWRGNEAREVSIRR